MNPWFIIISFLPLAAKSLTFLSIGDWGASSISSQDSYNVLAVAQAMAQIPTNFTVGLGDSFYWCGIQNTSDFQISVDWVTPYKNISAPWYQILGNHDYGYNVSAQLDLANVYPGKWIMDDRYYTRRMEVSEDVWATFIFLDTSPCISDYRGSNPDDWDPCGNDFPNCSLDDTNDDFEGTCQFHENILAQNCTAQYEWFVDELAKVSENDWLIVIGHHPIDELDVEDFTSVLQKHGFSLYINGHTHLLNQYMIDGKGAYITSGSGSLINVPQQTKRLLGHSYSVQWSKTIAGFVLHNFTDENTLKNDFIDYTGKIIHSFSVNRTGVIQVSEPVQSKTAFSSEKSTLKFVKSTFFS